MRKRWIVMSWALVLAGAGQASAASIGINFGSNRPGGEIAPTETAGVVAQANWNNAPNQNGSTSDITGPVAGTVVDDSNAATGVTVNWSASKATWNANNSFTGGDAKLMKGYLDSKGTNTVTVSDIDYAAYHVYVYVGQDKVSTGSMSISNAATTYYFTTQGNGASSFVEATATAPNDAATSNYMIFSNLTGASFTITEGSVDGTPGMFGMQIVEVPEPATMAMLAAGGVVMLARRRQA